MGGRLKAVFVMGTLALLFAVPSVASAATITPNTTVDETGGACSLRDAISSANNNTNQGGCVAQGTYGDDTIPLPAGTYVLTIPPDGTPDDNADGDLDIGGLGSLTISHSGLDPAAIDATGIDRVVDVGPSAAATISGVTIRNGNAGPGAGINNAGTLTLSSSTLSGSFATSSGGGLNNAGTANLINVTISGNSANINGGGIRNFSGTTTLNNVTVSANTSDADSSGGGDGAINEFGGTLNLKNTIVAGNQDASGMAGPVAPDCFNSPTSQGHNLIGNTANCAFTPTTGDLTGVNPLLGPLAGNGGSTFTHGLPLSSPAVDKGSSSLTADQRGFLRPVDFPDIPNAANAADIGAFELQRGSCKGKTATHIAAAGVPTIGTPGPDVIVGSDSGDVIRSRGGRDLICAEGGKDKVNGGKAGDRIFGQKGRDRLKGKRGPDKLKGGKGRDSLKGGKGRDVCKGGKGNDSASACEVEKSI